MRVVVVIACALACNGSSEQREGFSGPLTPGPQAPLLAPSSLILPGRISPQALPGGTIENYTPIDAVTGAGAATAFVVSQDLLLDTALGGLVGTTNGTWINLHNISTSHRLTLNNQDGGTASASEFQFIGGGNITLCPGDAAQFYNTGSALRGMYYSLSACSITAMLNPYSGGTHWEFKDEHLSSPILTNAIDHEWQAAFVGTGAGFSAVASTGRLGVIAAATGTTTTGRATFLTSATIPMSLGTYTSNSTFGFPALSNGTDTYGFEVGFLSTGSSMTQSSGCYAAYDQGGVLSAPTTGVKPTGNILGCWSGNGNTTAYPMDGSTHDDSGNPTVSVPIAARTWPSTNILHVQIVETPTSCTFYVDQGAGLVQSCVITTHVPNTATLGEGWTIIKSAGTTSVSVEADFDSVISDQTAVRAAP